jgi:RNA polymerase sigma factor (sigma-70 family)
MDGTRIMNDMRLVVEPLIPALRRYARAQVRDGAMADDLVQDCLERVITRWYQRKAGGDARAWIFAILHNLTLNRLRQTRRRGPHAELEDVDEAQIARPATQEEGLHFQQVLRALHALPEEQRSVMLLVAVEDLSYADAARVLDIPVGTVMSRLHRARERLACLMDAGTNGVAQAVLLRRIK